LALAFLGLGVDSSSSSLADRCDERRLVRREALKTGMYPIRLTFIGMSGVVDEDGNGGKVKRGEGGDLQRYMYASGKDI
jgi:hypothetical protein